MRSAEPSPPRTGRGQGEGDLPGDPLPFIQIPCKESCVAISEFFAGMPVADFASAVPWYERLWGKPPDFYPEEGEAVWQITGHSWVYVVTDRQRAGNGLITLLIDDLEDRIAQLSERGIETGPV